MMEKIPGKHNLRALQTKKYQNNNELRKHKLLKE